MESAKTFATDHQYRKASAEYLGVVCQIAREHRDFEQLRAPLDDAFVLAPKLTPDEKQDFVEALNEILNERSDFSVEQRQYIHERCVTVLEDLKGEGASLRASESIRLAHTYIQQKKTTAAEILLTALLNELGSKASNRYEICNCLEVLTTLYQLKGQARESKECWKRLIPLAREVEPIHYVSLLQTYILFLLENHMYTEARTIGDEFLQRAWQPDQLRSVDRRNWRRMAREFASADQDEASKFYKSAYDVQVKDTDPPSNSGYGSTAIEWATMLKDRSRGTEAKAVLKNALAYSKTIKPYIAERNVGDLAKLYENILESEGNLAEAQDIHQQYQKESADLKLSIDTAAQKRQNEVISDPNADAGMKVQALLAQSQKAREQKQCELAIAQIDQAIKVYEHTDAPKSSDSAYRNFYDIRMHLIDCGRKDDGTDFLWRIVKKRLAVGYPDPDYPTDWHSECGAGRRPLPPEEELLNIQYPQKRDEFAYRKLLELAKISGNPINVIAVLAYGNPNKYTWSRRKADYYETVEEWRKSGAQGKFIVSMLQTAAQYVDENRITDAKVKLSAAERQLKSTADLDSLVADHLRSAIKDLADRFWAAKCKEEACNLYLQYFKRSCFSNEQNFKVKQAVDQLANVAGELAKSNDLTAAEELLRQAETIAESSSNLRAVREMRLQLAFFYEQRKQLSSAYTDFDLYQKDAKSHANRVVKVDERKLAAELYKKDYDSDAESISKNDQKASKEKAKRESGKVSESNAPEVSLTKALSGIDKHPLQTSIKGAENNSQGGDGGTIEVFGDYPHQMDLDASGGEGISGGHIRMDGGGDKALTASLNWIFRSLENRSVQYPAIARTNINFAKTSNSQNSKFDGELDAQIYRWQKDFAEELIEKFEPSVRGGIIESVCLDRTRLKSIKFSHFTRDIPFVPVQKPDSKPVYTQSDVIIDEDKMKQNLTEATRKVVKTAVKQLPLNVSLVRLKFIVAGDPAADSYMWKGWQILDKFAYAEMTSEMAHSDQVSASDSHEIKANGR